VTASNSNLPPSGNERLGTWLRGKYRLDAVLGIGGMAVVFAVTHRNGRRFALKMLHAELSLRPDLRKRFLREGYIANAVGHLGAVVVLDDDVGEDGSAFLVMELLDGEGLDAMLTRHPGGIPVPAALSLGYQLLDVLSAAHAKNIVHRDIKPGNLFATRAGELKVLDFGIARLQEPEGRATTRTGMTMGTPAFMAPEQAMGKPIDARADLFSVGATLFTLLSGRFVHQGDTGQELMVKAATEPAPPLASIAPQIPEAVAACVDRALAFGLTDRWQSAERMQAALADAFLATTGAELSGAPLAEIVASAPSVVSLTVFPDLPSPAAMPPGVALPVSPPRTPTVPLPGAPPPPPGAGQAVVLGPGSGQAKPEEKSASPITGEPVFSTNDAGRAIGPGGTPAVAANKPVVFVVLGAVAFTAIAAGVIFVLKAGNGHPTMPPSTAAAVSAIPIEPSSSVGLAATIPPVASVAPPAPVAEPHEIATAPAAPATTHATNRSTGAPSRAATAAPDGGSRRESPKVDPWATP
jgi:serine/threonine-protein kinase